MVNSLIIHDFEIRNFFPNSRRARRALKVLNIGHIVRMKHTLGEKKLKLVHTMYEFYVWLKLADYHKYQAALFAYTYLHSKTGFFILIN